ncbi:MAG: glycoside hydrolase family 3 C-terminal domain-containing protein [Tractidigestivibacter sp.]|uniref:glycoside hydrolase family 3 protein n=1 Tax=Tractidigestivibacter sp. TaxID=2847320 RepID=UPI003D950A66
MAKAGKRAEKAAKPLTRRGLIGGAIASAGLVGLTVAGNVAGNAFSSVLDSKLGRGDIQVDKAEGSESWDAQYYKPRYSSLEEAKAASDVVSEQVSDEGIVLLKNNGVLPLAAGDEVTPFGWAFQNPAYFGTGAAASSDMTMVTAEDAIASKLTVNRTALDAAEGAEPTYPDAADGTDPLDFDVSSFQAQMDKGESAKIYEYDPAIYDAVSGVEGTCGVVVIKRCGSEGIDKRFEGYEDGTPHYLALTEDEKGVIAAAKRACGSVVVVLNTSNPVELGPLMSGELEADAIVWVGTAGSRGFASLAKVLVGEVNPSGRLTDIYATDFTADPTFSNFGRFQYTNSEVVASDPTRIWSEGEGSQYTMSRSFVEYQEGVYMGYRYYETAASVDASFVYGELDEQGAATVAGRVAYPFGYGLSYTTFDQKISSLDDSGDDVVLTVSVTNTGEVAGKEVVQVYYGSPYTDYDRESGVEKPECVLAAFAKTDLLDPGDCQELTLSFAKETMASYDRHHANSDGTIGCYILEAGDYAIDLRKNSHQVIESYTVTIDSDVVFDSSNPRKAEIDAQSAPDNQGNPTGSTFDGSAFVAATNKLDSMNAYMDETSMLTRADWEASHPTEYSGRERQAPEVALEEFAWFDNFDPMSDEKLGDVEGSLVYHADQPASAQQNGLSLIDLRCVPYDDERWDLLLDQIDWDGERDSLIKLLCGAAYQTIEVSSVGKPATTDADGAMGWSSEGASGWAAANVQAATWNVSLMNQMGQCIGEEALQLGMTGWYAPAVNIHRSPFSGRFYEYYSEDPLVSGKIAAAAISGAVEEGCICYLKHYAFNEQETDRSNSLATWVDEQTAREIYLKAFEVALQSARATISYISDSQGTMSSRAIRAVTGIMSAQNSIGGTMGFCHLGTQQKILREEWGFTGSVVTDLYLGAPAKDRDLVFRTGGNMYMTTMVEEPVDYTSATARYAMRNAMRGILYATTNSNAMNGIAPGSTVSYSPSPWRIGLTAASVAMCGGAAAIVASMVRKKRAGRADAAEGRADATDGEGAGSKP